MVVFIPFSHKKEYAREKGRRNGEEREKKGRRKGGETEKKERRTTFWLRG
jgi:hypothetical protein